jgi:C-terminal processing protease CtpA/Prc
MSQQINLDEHDYDIVKLKGKYLSLERDEQTNSYSPLSKLPTIDLVRPNSHADRAGLRVGDYVYSLDGVRTNKKSNKELSELVSNKNEKIKIVILRRLVESTPASLIAAEANKIVQQHDQSLVSEQTNNNQENGQDEVHRVRMVTIVGANSRDLGFTIGRLESKPGIYRVAAVEPNSAAHAAGLRENDYIIEIAGQNVRILPYEEIVNLIKAKKEENDMELLVTRVPPQNAGN